MSYSASARLDGLLLCESVQVGVLLGTRAPAACFDVSAGPQTHPVWALGQLAFLVYAYYQSAAQRDLEVCLGAGLVSDLSCSLLVADHIQWYTSRKIRTNAERLLSEMRLERWPETALELPVSFPARMASIWGLD
jgi:hypothetical protein